MFYRDRKFLQPAEQIISQILIKMNKFNSNSRHYYLSDDAKEVFDNYDETNAKDREPVQVHIITHFLSIWNVPIYFLL